jgi:hypothetical protein
MAAHNQFQARDLITAQAQISAASENQFYPLLVVLEKTDPAPFIYLSRFRFGCNMVEGSQEK